MERGRYRAFHLLLHLLFCLHIFDLRRKKENLPLSLSFLFSHRLNRRRRRLRRRSIFRLLISISHPIIPFSSFIGGGFLSERLEYEIEEEEEEEGEEGGRAH